jgi:hypothetical protein
LRASALEGVRPAWRGLGLAGGAQECGEFGAGGDVEFLEDVGEVDLDDTSGDVELLGDFAVAVSLGGEGGDAVLGGSPCRSARPPRNAASGGSTSLRATPNTPEGTPRCGRC